jgi:DNA-directed RNA polymerase specialized sigma24 family protein
MPMHGSHASFWEVPVDPASLEGFPEDSGGHEASRSEAGERSRRDAVAVLGELVRTRMTARQRRLVELYFFEGRTQQEIARELRVSQQAISRQIFGVLRKGRRVGGAVQRLRKLCAELGIDPDEWV